MQNKEIIAAVLVLTSFTVTAKTIDNTEPVTSTATGFKVADTRGQDRRDDRSDDRDDRQDCRQEEGRVGDDKRDCKQDNRSGDDS